MPRDGILWLVPMPYQLDCLNIEQFRGLRGLRLDGLDRVNLLVGPNDTGKTSVLEAILTYVRPLDPSALLTAANRRQPFHVSGEPPYDFVEWVSPHPAKADSYTDVGSWECSVQSVPVPDHRTEQRVGHANWPDSPTRR